ncbi:MAG: RNA polymerase sigma factor [Planctomycetes bacterium]|nr:RNA polymerase sigma factor [Planctomycetota bacterium]MCW8135415.1 RNA polymerase sigma factor [Planctomycetota bacterium]
MAGTGEPRDDSVVDNARNGLPGSFEALVRQYHAAIYRQILLVVNGDRAAADDVAQETWWRIAKGVKRFEGRSGFYAWACRIAHNEGKRWLGRNARKLRLVPEQATEQAPEEAHPAEQSEVNEQVRKVLAMMPQKFSAPLMLELWEDMPLREIAKALGVPEGTVKSRLFRAREKFRELWQQVTGEQGQ